MPFPEAVEIAKYIKNNSGPDDKIAVLGSEPEIYFYSHRRSASAYIYVYSIVEPQPYAADMQREMISQIEAAKPKFIVDVKCYNSWLLMPDSEKLIFEWMREYLPIHYRQVGLVEIFFPAGQTVYTWTSTAEPLKKEGYLLIYKRID